MERSAVPAELKRAVLVEAGHRCAIPRCGATELDVHHIVPWEECQKHEYSNLIALCPVCHRRAHKGEIDRKALRVYKAALSATGSAAEWPSFDAPVVEVKRRISETSGEFPGYRFEFDFPDFREPGRRVVSKNLEAWGNELLVTLREFNREAAKRHVPTDDDVEGSFSAPSQFRGRYDVVRDDEIAISVVYSLDRFFTGNVHGACMTRVQNFMINPFEPITISSLLSEASSLSDLSRFVRSRLIGSGKYDADWVVRGTGANIANFDCFAIEEHGLRLLFDEYQIDCFAAGRQELWVAYDDLAGLINPRLLSRLKLH